ncbi:MAG: response regulator transcription factor [Candidatus Nanopelagicales bacterium]|nr:response regulator transcription factor [Candidatus Nanopelagicales bacterium]
MIAVVVAEDQALLRGALCEILSRTDDIQVVGQCARGDEVPAEVVRLRPDVAVLDIEMPGLDGLEVARQLTSVAPATRVLMLTVFGKPGYLRRAMNNGALGFVLKDSPPDQLVDAIRRTANGERVVDPELAITALRRGDSPLTPRETEVLAASRRFPGTADLARHLHLSAGTVRNTISTAIQKLAATGRADAARIADDNGWL